ncbi:MAG TPA: 6,7-dimethyl-8-ribityllumazine synthase [Gemmatimonadaceae bacterium]|nr:6,7-dimethyl-8-ribityllumazine synthase [Gemmatimonadaceae bacterium]
MAEFVGLTSGAGRRFAIAASRFNQPIVEKLLDGALETLVDKGVALDDVDIVWVPGAWELPMAVRRLLASDRYSGVVAVGAVIRGDTPHFEFISAECARGLAQASAEFDVPVGFGVLTTDDDAQAEARAGGDMGNKGHEAAMAVLEMADLFDRLDVANES